MYLSTKKLKNQKIVPIPTQRKKKKNKKEIFSLHISVGVSIYINLALKSAGHLYYSTEHKRIRGLESILRWDQAENIKELYVKITTLFQN